MKTMDEEINAAWEQVGKAYANNFWSSNFSGNYYGSATGTYQEDYSQDPVFKLCIKDAIEYFEPLGVHVKDKLKRMCMDKPTKERVVAFLKNRLAFHGENGVVL